MPRRTYPETGNVKPWVKQAAIHFGNKYNISTVGGVAPRSTPSEHPEGLALDFMTKNRVKGTALAADVLANAKAYNVIYVIWWRRINSADGKGWKPYSGSSPHTDHVHVSFGPKPGTGSVSDMPIGTVTTGTGDGGLFGAFGQISDQIAFLADPHTWLRLASILGGGVLVLIGLVMLTKQQGVKAATQTVRKSVTPRTIKVKVK